ncbi:MAG TPA: glutamine amidotransferase [Xanthomonadaceae bacterium]|jgi:GMP synthase (glutamine-hydrolysing)|nr:glutamine amidotransferase [Xanthomonadaceae bacterium]
MTMNAPFLIVETGDPAPSLRRYGCFAHWIRVAAGLHRDHAVVCRVIDGEPLPRREGYAGVLITGSGAMVTERLDWSERAAKWLAEAAHAGLPLFGICYGHQLIAHALGGEVGWNPVGREIGTVRVERLAEADNDPLFGGHPPAFDAHATHMQSVLRLPEGAVKLARSDRDGCHAYRWGRSAWGVQFHPEFSTAMMRGYIAARREKLLHEGIDRLAIERTVTAAPLARTLLRRFVRHARSLHGSTHP